MPTERDQALLRAIQQGAWVHTKTPPYRAVMWGAESPYPALRGRRWVEILRSGERSKGVTPQRFTAEDITPAGPTDMLSYPPEPQAPICGWWLAEEGRSESGARLLLKANAYCARPTLPGRLCAQHEAVYQSYAAEETNGEVTS